MEKFHKQDIRKYINLPKHLKQPDGDYPAQRKT